MPRSLVWPAVLLLSVLQAARGQCPSVCSCIGATNTMDCTPRPDITMTDFRFTTIPQDGPPDTRVIIMSGNLLTSLAPGSFVPYPSLEVLVLNDNLFTEIPSEGFFNLSISNLTFDGNPLTGIQPAAFSNLTSLLHLTIRRTLNLGSIDGRETFSGLDSLVSLSLDDDLLDSLPADFLNSTPQLTSLSLRNNSLQTLSDTFLSPTNSSQIQIDLSLNPWSCDCFLQWLRDVIDTANNILTNDMETLCQWPDTLGPPAPRLSQVPAMNFRCFPPTLTAEPENTTILSNMSLTIPCGVDAAPFPEVTWIKDNVPLNLTERVHISRYNAALQFESQGVDDSGDYQCVLINVNGTVESTTATITILEATCFDNLLTSSHETDEDCGGEFCVPCNVSQGCLLDRDCEGDLVCLYTHSLPSSLLYISPTDPRAFTCAEPTVPETLLEAILQSELPFDITAANVSGGLDSPLLHTTIRNLLAMQLEVSTQTITNVRVSSVEKTVRPLIQIWFDLARTPSGEEGGARLLDQLHSGALKATVRIQEDNNLLKYRLNL